MKNIIAWENDRCNICTHRVIAGETITVTSNYEFCAHEHCYDWLRIAQDYYPGELSEQEKAQFEKARFADEQTERKSFTIKEKE